MSKQENQSFYKHTFIITLILAALMLMVQLSSLSIYLNDYAWYVLLYMVSLSTLTFFLREKGLKTGDPHDVYNYAMVATTIRLLVSAVVLFLYFLIVKENLGTFIFIFFVHYFIYTAFEIKSLFPKLRTVSGKE
jgi:hypothetical protein